METFIDMIPEDYRQAFLEARNHYLDVMTDIAAPLGDIRPFETADMYAYRQMLETKKMLEAWEERS